MKVISLSNLTLFNLNQICYSEFNYTLFYLKVGVISIKVPVSIPSSVSSGFWWYGISVSGPFEQPGQYIKKVRGIFTL